MRSCESREVLQAGDLVFLCTRLIPSYGVGERKPGPRWVGPLAVPRRFGGLAYAYVVDLSPSMRVHGTVNVRFLGSAKCRLVVCAHCVTPASIDLGGWTSQQLILVIGAIVQSRQQERRDGTTESQYLVEWKDSGAQKNVGQLIDDT